MRELRRLISVGRTEQIDWRARLHSLPSGIGPTPRIFIEFFRVLLAVGLFLFGASVTSFIIGVIALFGEGIGPNIARVLFCLILGFIGNLAIGVALTATITRRSASRATYRLIFYSFTAPAYLAALLFAGSIFVGVGR